MIRLIKVGCLVHRHLLFSLVSCTCVFTFKVTCCPEITTVIVIGARVYEDFLNIRKMKIVENTIEIL